MTDQPIRVLIVDDELAHAEAIRRALLEADMPVEVQVADSLRQFRNTISQHPPHLVLLDFILPDGKANAALISPPEAGPFPMVVMTSHGDEQVAVSAIRQGALDYVVKSPAAFADMPRTVERTLRSWQVLQDNRRAQESLLENERMLRMALETGRIGAFEVELATGRATWSPIVAEIWGLPTDFKGDLQSYCWQHIHPDDLARVIALYNQMLQGTCEQEHELRIIRPDGTVRWIRWRGRALRNQAGEPVRVIGVNQDITERHRAEEALRESEMHRTLAMNAAQMGTWDWDLQTGKVRWSEIHDRLWGYAPGAFPGTMEAFAAPIPTEDLARIWRVDEEAKQARTPFECEFRVRHPGGVTYWVSSHGRHLFDAQGKVVRVVGVTHDITHRKQAEQSLREGLLFRREAEKIARIGAWKVNPATDYLYWTEGVYEIVEAPSHYKPGLKEGLDFYDAGVIPALQNALQTALTHGTPFCIEAGLTTMTGRHLLTEVRGLGRVEEGGQSFVMGTFQDITERRHLEEQLRQAQKLEAIGQLAGGVAHDFNNIIAAFMMNLDLLTMAHNLDAETKQVLRELSTDAHRASSLTRQLLMFSRRSVLAIQPVNLHELAGNLMKMLGRLIGEDIKLVFESQTGTLPGVEADPGMLEQVLMNLAVNARDAMPKGGRITIAITLQHITASDQLDHASRKLGPHVCLNVSDTGCGMDEAVQKRIFEPFFTTKELGKGTGLGLATVHGIVAQHKGWVEVESKVGQGSTFRVFLPAMGQLAAPSAKAAPAPAIQRGLETILLVEDDSNVRQAVGRALRIMGYAVFEAENGQTAMQIWQAHHAKVDLLLTDMVMPEGITGLELAQRLQACKPGLKVIISSGYSTEVAQAGVPSRPGLVYFPKPYDFKPLADTLRKCLDNTF